MSGIPGWRLGLIAKTLHRGGVIAYPTEGVWGLGCLPTSGKAVARILALKRRSWQQGLLLVASHIDQFASYLAGIEPRQLSLLEADWPGPVTYLVPDNGAAPRRIVGNHDTLGLRVSAHPLVSALCRSVGPLVSTSANISGRPAAMSALQVRRYFGGSIDQLVPGELGGEAGPSRIKVLATGDIVR